MPEKPTRPGAPRAPGFTASRFASSSLIDLGEPETPASKPRPIRTGRFNAEDLAPPPRARLTGRLRDEDLAGAPARPPRGGSLVPVEAATRTTADVAELQAIPEKPAPPPNPDFTPADVAGLSAQLEAGRRRNAAPDSLFARGFFSSAAPAPAPYPARGTADRDVIDLPEAAIRVVPAMPSSPAGDSEQAVTRATGPVDELPASEPALPALPPRALHSAPTDGDVARQPTSNPASTVASIPAALAHDSAPATAAAARDTGAASPPPMARPAGEASSSAADIPVAAPSPAMPAASEAMDAASRATDTAPGEACADPDSPACDTPAGTPAAAHTEPRLDDSVTPATTAPFTDGTANPRVTTAPTAGPAAEDIEWRETARRHQPSGAARIIGSSAAVSAPAERRAAAPKERPAIGAAQLWQCGLALAAAAAAVFLMTMGWPLYGAWGVLPLAAGLLAALTVAAARLERRGRVAAASLAAILATASVPLCVYFLQLALGLWPPMQGLPPITYGQGIVEIDWRRVVIDGATLGFAFWMFWRHRRPVLLAPLVLVLWYGLLELGSFVMSAKGLDFRFLCRVSALHGAFTLLAATWLQFRLPRGDGIDVPDYAFWPQLIGAGLLWASLWAYPPVTALGRCLHVAANLGFIAWYALPYAPMRRRAMLALGALGLALHAVAWATGSVDPLRPVERTLQSVADGAR